MSTPGMDEIEDYLDPAFEVPSEVAPDLADILPRGYLSVSQVNNVISCAHAWELQYVDGKPPKRSARPFQGVQVHRAVEQVLQQRIDTGVLPPLDVALDIFSDEFDSSKKMVDDWDGEDPDFVKKIGLECTKAYHEEAADAATPVEVEKKFHTVVTAKDGKFRLPILGRIDSIQVQTHSEQEYQDIREKIAAAGDDPTAALAQITKPLRIHDLKVVTDKWNLNDLENDLQFAIYAGVTHTPDVQVDQVVKGRAKVPRPRYEQLVATISNKQIKHSIEVAAGVAKTIALGHFPMTAPDSWKCSERWCSMWRFCRGAQ